MAGEIELLTTRTLTHVVGHDSGGLAGRSPVSSVLSTVYGSVQTSNYTTVATDLNLVIAVQTGTGTIVVTLMSAATAGNGAIQSIEKVDTGKGQVRVMDDTGTLMGFLTYPTDRIDVTPDQDGTGWHPISDRARRFPPVSGNIYPPMVRSASAHIASGAPLVDTIYLHAFELPEPMYIDALVINIGATSAAGLKFKTGLWAWDPTSIGNPTGATLLSAGAEVGSAGTLTRGGYPSVLDTPQWVQRGYVGSKWNATPAVANLVTGINAVVPFGSTAGREVLGAFTDDVKKGWTLADTYANAFTTLGTMVASTSASVVPIIGLRAG
jgi:hypothetical protein